MSCDPTSITSNTAAFFGNTGIACSLVFAVLGAAYGTAKAGVGVSASGVLRPELIMRNVIPVVMAGVVAVYGLIVSMILATSLQPQGYCDFNGFCAFGAGLCVGLSGMAAGIAIGIVGDAGVRATSQQPKLFAGMILMLIMAEALGLYGLIVSLIIAVK